ncbi:hypothetical protein JCM10207_007832 [Rhodosporidiobolus poonsookiae]
MGFFNSASSAPPTPANTTTAALDVRSLLFHDRDEVIRRLTRELVEAKESNSELEEKYRAAIGARTGAVNRVRELEDVLRLKEGIFETQERQIELLERQNVVLREKEDELVALRLDQAEHPISATDAAHRLDQLGDVFEQLKDTLSCPVCYEPFGRDQAVSLTCGHTFCKGCYTTWESRHVEAFRLSPQQGAYVGPECPECRTADPRRAKVRIWALEEVVRLVDRGVSDLAKAPPFTPAGPPRPCSPSAPASSSTLSASFPSCSAAAPPPQPSSSSSTHVAPVNFADPADTASTSTPPPQPAAAPAAEAAGDGVATQMEDVEAVDNQPPIVFERERRAYGAVYR